MVNCKIIKLLFSLAFLSIEIAKDSRRGLLSFLCELYANPTIKAFLEMILNSTQMFSKLTSFMDKSRRIRD